MSLGADTLRLLPPSAPRSRCHGGCTSSPPLHAGADATAPPTSCRSLTFSRLSELQVKEFDTSHPCFPLASFLSFCFDISGSKACGGDKPPSPLATPKRWGCCPEHLQPPSSRPGRAEVVPGDLFPLLPSQSFGLCEGRPGTAARLPGAGMGSEPPGKRGSPRPEQGRQPGTSACSRWPRCTGTTSLLCVIC